MLNWQYIFMKIDPIFDNQPVIITLDIDSLLFDKIERVAQSEYTVIEINGIDAFMLERVLIEFSHLKIGVGNVVSAQQLEDAYQAGAHFVTSPGVLPALIQMAQIYSINYMPGVATLSEAMQASALGCQSVRPFPATLSFCGLLNKYLPLLRLFPAEVARDEMVHFLNIPMVSAVSLINPEIRVLEAI